MSASNAIAAAPKHTTYEFVVGQRPDQLNAGSNKKLRSHLSKRGWEVYLLQHNDPSESSSALVDKTTQRREDRARRKRRRRFRHTITWDVRGPDDPGYEGDGDIKEAMLALIRGGKHVPIEKTISMDHQLGGGRVDPFKSYPTPYQSYIPHLVDHCEFTPPLCVVLWRISSLDPSSNHVAPSFITKKRY
jgi:hypothetical protein